MKKNKPMTPVEKEAYSLRFERDIPSTYEEIGKKIGASRQYAHQVVCSAIKKKIG
jgi:DNA-directed RNA polymerase sigma subunit (sigma70/sigma32)